MKAFRNVDTLIAFTDGFQIYYNFFKPHHSLKGKTPAEAAKVDYQIKNWKELCQLPVSKQTEVQSHRRISDRRLRVTPPTPKISEGIRKLR